MAEKKEQFCTGAVRFEDPSKPRCDLMSPIALLAYAEIMAEGAARYGDRNWEKGLKMSNLVNHHITHFLKWMAGDTTEPHLKHALWNMAALVHNEELIKRGLLPVELDDMPKFTPKIKQPEEVVVQQENQTPLCNKEYCEKKENKTIMPITTHEYQEIEKELYWEKEDQELREYDIAQETKLEDPYKKVFNIPDSNGSNFYTVSECCGCKKTSSYTNEAVEIEKTPTIEVGDIVEDKLIGVRGCVDMIDEKNIARLSYPNGRGYLMCYPVDGLKLVSKKRKS